MGLENESTAQRVAVIVEFLHVLAAKTCLIGGKAYIGLHIAGTGTDHIANGALLGLTLEVAERTLVAGIEGLVDGYGVDQFFHGAFSF